MINSIGSTSTSLMGKAAGTGNGHMGKDEFLKLLVAQLRHQDPLNPMQGQDLAVQLAQFSSVEQLMDLNSTLQGQAGFQTEMLDTLNSNAAWGAIGRTVLARGDLVEYAGDATQRVTAEIDGLGGAATLRVLDANGREIGSRALGFMVGGKHQIELGSAVQGLAPGTYSVKLDVKDGAGTQIPTTMYTTARVDGLRYTADGPVLTSGGLDIPFGSVVQVFADAATTP